MKALICGLLIASQAIASSSNYPRSKEDKEEEEAGSILGGEGVIFRPGKVKNESTKNIIGINVNKYLWDAAIRYLDFVSIASVDVTHGKIVTDWYKDGKEDYRIIVKIQGDVISPESISVQVESKHNRQMTEVRARSIEESMEKNILRKARDLFTQDKFRT